MPAAAAPIEPAQACAGQPQEEQAAAYSAQLAANAAAASQGGEADAAPTAAAPEGPGYTSAGQTPNRQAAAAFAQPAARAAAASRQNKANTAPAAAAPAEPERASVGNLQGQSSLASVQPKASAAVASQSSAADALPAAAAPTKPGQACAGQPPEQQAAAASAQPAAGAAAASQSREADAAPAAEVWRALRPYEQKVVAALLVVLRTALNEGGTQQLKATKSILMANNPLTSPLLEQLPDDGSLPSLKQLGRLAADAPTYWMGRYPNQGQLPSDWMDVLAQQCAAAGFEPLHVFRRSTQCLAPVKALSKIESEELAARLQRLHAIEASLAISSPAQPNAVEIQQAIAIRVEWLYRYGMPCKLLDLISGLLFGVVTALRTDRAPGKENRLTAGAHTSFTLCFDHMLPGEFIL